MKEGNMETLKLPFGWHDGLVPGTRAAWGARLIVDQQGMVDILPDRQGAVGLSDSEGDEALVQATMEWLNSKQPVSRIDLTLEPEMQPIGQARLLAGYLLREYEMRTRKRKGFVLYSDHQGAIVGNTNASCGYLYISAYLFKALPEGHPTKGLEVALNVEEG